MPSGFADDGITRNPHPVVCGDVVPDEPPNQMKWLREKPVQVSVISEIPEISCTGNHILGQIEYCKAYLCLSFKEIKKYSIKLYAYRNCFGLDRFLYLFGLLELLGLLMSEELITPKEACRMLGVSTSTLRRWAYQGKIRYVRLPSGKLRYYRSDIEKILRGEYNA